jgi:MFS family permease
MRSRVRQTVLSGLHTLRTNPTVVAVPGEGFLTRLGFSMVSFALPFYALSLGMSLSEVGILYALRTATVVAVKPVMGWAADRYGRKNTLIAAVLLRCLVGLLFPFASLPWHLFAIRLLQGVVTAAREPSAAALIAVHGDKRSMASTFAWYTTARDLGRSFGAALAGLLIQATGSYTLVFVAAFLSSCVALITVIRYVRESPALDDAVPAVAELEDTPQVNTAELRLAETAAADAPPASRRAAWSVYRGLLGYASFGLMVAGSAEMMQGLFPVIATQYAGLSEGQAGLAVSIAAVASLASGPLFGWLSDNVSRKLALGARSVANTLSSLMYIFIPSFGGFVVAYTVDNSGKAAFRPTWGAILADISAAEPERRASLMSFVDSSYTVGEMVAPLAAGVLIATFGIPTMLAVRAALAVATEVQAVRVLHPARASAQHP